MMRYRIARALGKDRFREVLKEDAELLEKYGLKLLSVDCGVRAAVITEVKKNKREKNKGDRINPWNVIELSDKTWSWLHPLLLRLRELEEKEEQKGDEDI